MEESDPQIEELRALLGPMSELSVPSEVDQRTRRMGFLLAAGQQPAKREECPAAFVWLVVLEMVFALVLGVLAFIGQPISVDLPVPRQVLYLGAALNLLALLLSPIIVIPMRGRRAR